MQAKVEKGNLIITIPLQKAHQSKSGKTLLIATTRGFWKTEAEVEGKKVSVSLNATIPRD